MKPKSRNQTGNSFVVAKTTLFLFSILLLLFSVNGNSVLANQINTNKMQFAMPQESNDDEGQTQAPLFDNFLPLILNGLPAPSGFNKNAPANGSTGTSISPVLSWTASTNATKYEYCYDTSNDGTCSNWISTGINTYAGLSALQAGATYYWQIRAWNGTYGPTYANGNADAYWSFTTIVMAPGEFNKHAPASGSTGVSLSPILSWNTSTNATKYEYCYDTSNDGTCSNWISTGTKTYVGLWALQPNTTYYWQVRAWNGTNGPTYANGSPSQFWSFKTIQKRLVVFEGFLRPVCGICQRASVVIDQLATLYRDESVVFIEYDVDGNSNGRNPRWWDAYRYGGGEGPVSLPEIMVDSGNQISNGEVDFQIVYSGMVNASLLRPPTANITASWSRTGNEVETTIDITNISDINLSFENQATIFVIVYENARIGLTNRYVRAVAREEIASLAPGENAHFILTTNELVVADWNNINVIVIADYISDFYPDLYPHKFDTLQAVIATKVAQ